MENTIIQSQIGYIYKTTNIINGKIYIGQKKSKKFIPSYHGSGKCIKNAIKKYGKQNFITKILSWHSTYDSLNKAEIEEIEKHKARNNLIGYNLAIGGRIVWNGNPVSKETKEKIRKWYIEHPIPPEKRIEISEHMKALYNTPKYKKILSDSHMGHIVTEETRKKMSMANTGRKKTNEQILALSIARKGKKHTEEWKITKSKSMQGHATSQETRVKISIAHIGKIVSQETREKLRKAHKGHPQSDQTKLKISLANRKNKENIYVEELFRECI